MSSPRLASLLLLPIPLLPLLSAGWRANESTVEPPLVPLTPYVLPVTDGSCTFEIELSDERSYALIVGALARGERSFPVTIDVDRRPRAVPANPGPFVVEPIDPRLFRPDRPSAASGKSEPVNGSDEPRRFHVHVTDGPLDDERHYATVDARLVRRGRRVRVYLDEHTREFELASGLLDEIVWQLDNETLPALSSLLGSPLDVDGDGTLAVVLSPWLSRLEGGRTTIDGFVRASDFRADAEVPFGDRADVLYLNTSLRPGRRLRSVLAHECAHVVAISERMRWESDDRRSPVEEDWLNEAVAHVAEMTLEPESPNLVHRIDRYLESPASTPLVVPDYHAVGRWRDHACRGATFTFLDSSVTCGEQVLEKLVRSRSVGVPNLERATGLDFATLFRQWGVNTYLEHGGGGDSNSDRGPLRTHTWSAGDGPMRFDLHATANTFIELRGAGGESGAPTRIRVTAPKAASLQLTLVPLVEISNSNGGKERSGRQK